MQQPPLSRRHLLQSSACGFGYLAFAGLSSEARAEYSDPLAPKMPHFAPRAKRVIMLFMDGGPSHMDLFDYKPQLNRDHGKKGQKEGDALRHSVEVSATRRQWPVGFGTVASTCPAAH